MHFFSDGIERANVAKGHQIFFRQFRDTTYQIFDSLEWLFLSLRDNPVGCGLTHSVDITEPDAQARNILAILGRAFNRAVPFRVERVDGFHANEISNTRWHRR